METTRLAKSGICPGSCSRASDGSEPLALMAEHKRLMTIWRRGAKAPWTNLLRSMDGPGYATHQYTVDDSTEEALLWVVAIDTPQLSDQGGEVFTLTLARDVGARLMTPSPWLYIVHTDIPADVVADYN